MVKLIEARRHPDGFVAHGLWHGDISEFGLLWCREQDTPGRVERFLYLRVWHLLVRFSVTQ